MESPSLELDAAAPSRGEAPAPVQDGDGPSAGVLLKRAFDYFKLDDNVHAIEMFRASVGTGNLNDAGRALAYWHIYVSEQSINEPNGAAEALASFVVVAQDIMAVREQLRYAEDDSGDFVDRFDLKRRLARARAILSADWAERAGAFGRSELRPIPVHDTAEKDFFLEMASPCHGADRHVQTAANVPGEVERVNIQCDGQRAQTSYYFETVQEATDE